MMRVLRLLLAGLLAAAPATMTTAADTSMPAPLELHYVLRYGALTVGHVHKTLEREPDGHYRHRSHSVPKGMARWFTEVEWFEEGEFEIAQGQIRPLRFLEYRVGADKPHRHEAVFDWGGGLIRYASGATAKLAPGTQDQGTLMYALMRSPPAPGTQPELPVSTGKKLRSYRYASRGQEVLKTAFGPLKTQVVERIVHKADDEGFKIWLATEHHNLPVRIATIKRGQDTVLELESIRGAIALPGGGG